jgi:hypothetical protein
MKADVLRPTDDGTPRDEAEGGWVIDQDPDSGTIKRVWQSGSTDQGTPNDTSDDLESFPCIARGIIDGGIRVSGTTERFGSMYDAVDYVNITFPANVFLTRRDRITNIRDNKGNIIWVEEERGDGAPTVFSVNGVIPIVDPFGQHIENTALLERVEAQ